MLTKTVITDRLEIDLEFGVLSVRERIMVSEDGQALMGPTYHRYNLYPDSDVNLITNPDIKNVATAIWTDEIKAKYQVKKAQRSKL